MELTYLGKSEFPPMPGTPGVQPTYNATTGPFCVRNGAAVMRGHNRYVDHCEFPIPEPGQPVSVTRWFDPTFGKMAQLNIDVQQQTGLSVVNIRPRGVMIDENGLLFGTVQLYYNVSGQHLKGMYVSDGESVCNAWGRTSLPPLLVNGFIFDLPQAMRDHFGKDTGCFECSPQGTAGTNNGPGLFLFNRNPSLQDGETVELTEVFRHAYQINPYPDWWSDREINGACFTQTHFVCAYKRTRETRWYGLANGTSGHLKSDPPGTVAHPVYSTVNPGQLAVDPISNAKGYHSEGANCVLLMCSIESIIAGSPEWVEVDLTQYGLGSTYGTFAVSFDPFNSRLYVLEFSAVAKVWPRLHHFQVEEDDPAMIQQLLDQIAAMQAQLSEMSSQLTALQAEVAAKDDTIAVLQSDLVVRTSERDEAVNAKAALNLAIDQAQGQA